MPQTETTTAPQPSITPHWRILAYDKSGKTWNGIMSYATQDSALETIRDVESDLDTWDYEYIDTADGPLSTKDYAYAVALPIA